MNVEAKSSRGLHVIDRELAGHGPVSPALVPDFHVFSFGDAAAALFLPSSKYSFHIIYLGILNDLLTDLPASFDAAEIEPWTYLSPHL